MRAPLPIALIGLGNVAEAHIEAYALTDAVRIAAVCDVRPLAVTRAVERTGARGYSDVGALLAAGGFELGVVLTPACSHCAIVAAVARAGIHVLCEKPLAVTVEDAQVMLQSCRDAGVKLFYGSCYRYLPAVVRARELIAANAIGEVQLLCERVLCGQGLEGYRDLGPGRYPAGGPGGSGFGLVDHGVHLIDVFPWMCGSPVVEAHGCGQISGATPRPEHLIMLLANGAEGHLQYCSSTFSTTLPSEGHFSGGRGWTDDGRLTNPGRWEAEPGSIHVYGSRGALRILYYANALYQFDRSGVRQLPLSGRAAPGHFATQIEDCVSSIREGRDPPVPGEAGLAALSALLRAY